MISHLRLDDPEHQYAAVRLRSDLPLADSDLARVDGGWVLDLPPLRLDRLEYQLEVTERNGRHETICDPVNPERAPGAFGEKSVLTAPGYLPPTWLHHTPIEGFFEELGVRVLSRELVVRVWSPASGPLPLLAAHDGPEYDELSGLTRYAGAMVASGALPPFRVALLPPGDRNEWYSASAAYGRSLCRRILPAIGEQVDVAGQPVGMGASLGGLAMLQAQRSWPGVFGGLFLQSGSFFVSRYDRHESGFPRYGRIARFVSRVRNARAYSDPVPVVMTCGAEEENVHNNRLMAAALTVQGYPSELHEVADLHNYTSWRDTFDPHLTGLLAGLWGRA